MKKLELSDNALPQQSLLDWYSLAPRPEVKGIGSNGASALGNLLMKHTLQDGGDIHFVGTDIAIAGQRINGIRRIDVQGFRESETIRPSLDPSQLPYEFWKY